MFDTPIPDQSGGHEAIVFAIKAFHSLAFLVIQSCILHRVYSGARGRSDRRAVLAAGIAIGEAAVYTANGFRCPLTSLALRYGARSVSVTEIFLPPWLAANIARVYTPLLVLGVLLHLRNLRLARATAGA